MIDFYREYIESGFRVFGLHGVTKGKCDCGNPDCTALYKHPRMSNWQLTPVWSEEQLETMEDSGQFDTGYGILVQDHLVVDVDPRNGGDVSFEGLCIDLGLDLRELCKHVVNTGGGGFHLFFSLPDERSLMVKVGDYPGIDFKTSGFVVGAGSLHVSGDTYEVAKGSPYDVKEAPEPLLTLLERPDTYRAKINGVAVDVDESQINEMLSYLDADCDYETWVKVLMAVHHATGGTGLELVDKWSSKGAKYCGYNALERKWHSFGKARQNPCTLGTLIYYAEKAGYKMPVTFEHQIEQVTDNEEINVGHIDLTRPPGFVGEVAEWVRLCSDMQTDHLAVASALAIVSNVSGLNYISDDPIPVYSNLFLFCVAGSGAGKNAMMGCVQKAMAKVGYSPAINSGSFKSEQAIVRSMIRHQLVAYVIDEIGLELTKIGRGQADYLQGITKNLMSAFSASGSVYMMEAEVREEAERALVAKITAESKLIDENRGDQEKLENLVRILEKLKENAGVEKPFVSITGYTTPETFNHLVSGYAVKQGFFTRALIFREKETVPKYDENYPGKPALPTPISNILCGLAATGTTPKGHQRIENTGETKVIPTTDSAQALLKKIRHLFYTDALKAKKETLESIYSRAYELTLKVSLVLAVGEGVRTTEHVLWAYALVKNNLEEKLNLAAANMAEDLGDYGQALCRRIVDQLSKQGTGPAITVGVLKNRLKSKKWTDEDVDKAIDVLEANHKIHCEQKEYRGRFTKTLYLV